MQNAPQLFISFERASIVWTSVRLSVIFTSCLCYSFLWLNLIMSCSYVVGAFSSRIINMYYAYPLLRFPKVHMAFVYVFCGFDLGIVLCKIVSHEIKPTFRDARNDCRNSKPTMRHYPHLDSASDWVKQTFNQPEALHSSV